MASKWAYAFAIYWFLAILAYEKVLKKIRPITHGNEEIHKRFPAFRRYDKDWFTNRPLYYLLVWTFLPRFIITAFGMVSMALGCVILSIGLPKGKNVPITGLRYLLMRIWTTITARITIFGITMCFWVRTIRPKTCYKKYLGESWKADYDGFCSTMVANHSAF